MQQARTSPTPRNRSSKGAQERRGNATGSMSGSMSFLEGADLAQVALEYQVPFRREACAWWYAAYLIASSSSVSPWVLDGSPAAQILHHLRWVVFSGVSSMSRRCIARGNDAHWGEPGCQDEARSTSLLVRSTATHDGCPQHASHTPPATPSLAAGLL
ncbi:hypothetical protein G7Z17_g12483 [Cylindrodendrum hubeiense]|uniref:Uncharacterized protein n=1 Tax=Cylindrodendrum hubeiense TaxID=595255 RepID=A0A9P5GTZ2_9HYPO|nr:hypothetical protein G7Z17_g12483 [Cylindrodendrum hubeiense]